MKIIFLDHDGPMVLRSAQEKKDIITNIIQMFSNECVIALNEILSKTDAEIVISSDWRLYFSLAKLKEIYRDIGVITSPISKTPNFWNKTKDVNDLEKIRATEILSWLAHNGKYIKVTNWVVVDDMKIPLDKCVQTDAGIFGISDPKIKNNIIKVLNS